MDGQDLGGGGITLTLALSPDRGMYLVFPASGWQIIFGSAGGPGRGSGSNKTLFAYRF